MKLGLEASFKITDTEILHVRTKSRITFTGLQINIMSIKSVEGVTLLWVEEAQSISLRSMSVAIPTFLRKKGSRCFWTWNPDDEKDAVDAYFRGPIKPPDSLVVHVKQSDNPFWLETELPAQKMFDKERKSPTYDHVWLGGYNNNHNARIFTNTRIGRIEIPEHIEPSFGMDFGFANDPNFLTKSYFIPEAKILYIAQEIRGFATLPELPDFLDEVSESREYPIIADSSRPETIDYLNGKGFSMYAARKGPGSVKAGIKWLQGWEIMIDPDCLDMQDEARKYKWKLDREQKPMNIPQDKDNHGWDSMRYAHEESMRTEAANDDRAGSDVLQMSLSRRRG